jgi:hypothetical protein
LLYIRGIPQTTPTHLHLFSSSSITIETTATAPRPHAHTIVSVTTGNEHEPLSVRCAASLSLSRLVPREPQSISRLFRFAHSLSLILTTTSTIVSPTLLTTLFTTLYSITTAFGALSLVHRIYAFWSNHSLHSLSIRTYGKRHAVNCTSPKPWQTLTTTTSRRSLRRRRPRTQWPTRRRRRLLVTTTMACKSTSSPLTAMPALTPPSLVST